MPARSHGLSHTKTHRAWGLMKNRCSNVRDRYYSDYGGRGIKVCERWLKFENFLADMGLSPAGTSIDRIDNNRGYEPGNCRWATAVEQARNKRTTRFATLDGQTLPITEWCERIGIKYWTVMCRINMRGWSVEEALTTPLLRPQKRCG